MRAFHLRCCHRDEALHHEIAGECRIAVYRDSG
jgi:hypothetical protein